jgi:Holliday junction resolvasome RuvABC endonuclease subunit
MKVLALDVSTRSTGWFIDKKSYGKIEPDENLTFEQKLVYFRQEIVRLVDKYAPDTCCIEDAYYQPRKGSIHTLKTLCKFGGVAIEVCASRGITVEIMTATAARKYCCGRHEGKVTKEDVFAFFVTKYGFSDWKFSKHNDITDAMALSWGYREKIKAEKKGSEKKARN